jgi:membrane-associated phospholipid phosphatase
MNKQKTTFLCLLLLGLIAMNFKCVRAQNMDSDLLKNITGNYAPKTGSVMLGFTQSDTPISLGIPAAFLVYGHLKKDQETFFSGLEMLSAPAMNGFATHALKISFERERPFNAYPNEIIKHTSAGSFSFPSGHTSMAFATATSISLLYPKWYVVIPAYAWASTVAYSRMYLGVHYPSDVLAGALIGSGISLLVHYTFKVIKRNGKLHVNMLCH